MSRSPSAVSQEVLPPRPLSATNEDDISEVMSAEHFRRIQGLIVSSFDKQLASMQMQISDRDARLSTAQKAEQDLGAAYGQMKKEFDRIQAALEKHRTQVQKEQDKAARAETEKGHALQEAARLQKEKQEAIKAADAVRTELAATKQDLDTLRRVEKIYNSDVKMHAQIESSWKQENQALKDQQQKMQDRIDALEASLAKTAREKKALEADVQAQVSQTKIAQQAVDRVTKELNKAHESKEELMQQWEQAVAAMGKRDAAMGQAIQQHQEVSSRALSLETAERNLSKQNKALQVVAEARKKDAESKESTVAELTARVSALEQKCTSAEGTAEMYRRQLEETKQDLTDMTAKCSSLKTQLASKGERLASSQAETKQALEKLQSLQTSSRRDQQEFQGFAVRQAKAVESSEAEHVQRAAELENLWRRETALTQELQARIQQLQEEKQTVQDNFTELDKKYNRLMNESQFLQSEVSREKYLAAKTESELEKAKAPHPVIATLRHQLQQVQSELEAKNEELEKMKSAYIASEKAKVMQQLDSREQEKRQASREAEARVNEDMGRRVQEQYKKLQKDHDDTMREHDELRLQLHRSVKKAASLADENAALQHKVQDAMAFVQSKQDEHKSEVERLKAEVNMLREERQNARLNDGAERRALTLERRLQVAQTQCEDQKQLAAKTSSQVFELTLQLRAMQKRVDEAEKKAAAYNEQLKAMFTREAEARARPSSLPSPSERVGSPRGLSLTLTSPRAVSSPRHLSALASPANAEEVRRQIESLTSQLNRARTQTAEKNAEVVTLKQKLDQLSSSFADLKSQYNQVTQDLLRLKRELPDLQSKCTVLTQKSTRAEALAASLERQLIGAGQSDIDYTFRPDLAPSTDLRAAINNADSNSATQSINDYVNSSGLSH